MYAERKNISLSDVRIKLTHHRKDPAQNKDGPPTLERIDGIEGVIQLEGDLNEAQRKRMIEIAGRCMMHRTLSAGVDIRFHSPEE